MQPRVLILYNQPVLPKDHPDYESEAEVLYSVKIIGESLEALGITFTTYSAGPDLAALLERLQHRDYDIVFNLYEGSANRSITEVYLAGLLEWLEIPFTGNSAATLALAREKIITKRVLQGAGIRTPGFFTLRAGDTVRNSLGVWPVIVKPANEDASVGIEQGSVVMDEAALQSRIRFLLEQYGGTVLVEQYIPGRELQISVCELHEGAEPVVLPYSEIRFESAGESNFWPIYTYRAKWDEQSEEYRQASVIVGAEVGPELDRELKSVAREVFHTLGCRDYIRVDTRVTPEGEVYVLETNPNPSITSIMIDQGLPAVGSSYNGFIGALVHHAHRRACTPSGRRREIV